MMYGNYEENRYGEGTEGRFADAGRHVIKKMSPEPLAR
jgi:hypothetical protein